VPQLYPEGYAPAAAAPWARQALAASVRRDDEPASSSIYAAAQPPAALAAANFTAFVNGEPLRGQDVVAWVTLGAWDLPSAEAAPARATPGTRCANCRGPPSAQSCRGLALCRHRTHLGHAQPPVRSPSVFSAVVLHGSLLGLGHVGRVGPAPAEATPARATPAPRCARLLACRVAAGDCRSCR